MMCFQTDFSTQKSLFSFLLDTRRMTRIGFGARQVFPLTTVFIVEQIDILSTLSFLVEKKSHLECPAHLHSRPFHVLGSVIHLSISIARLGPLTSACFASLSPNDLQ